MYISWLFSLVLMLNTLPSPVLVVAKADDGLIPAHLPH